MKGLIVIEVFFGDIVFTKSKNDLILMPDSYIIVEDGKVLEVTDTLSDIYKNATLHDYSGKMLIPGFSDLHFHAPQFENIGLGLDEELIPWLNKYTFVEEEKFKDIDYAKCVYKRVLNEIWKQGTTRIVFFGTIHLEATSILLELMAESGICGYVGKVNMDRNAPTYLIEDSKKSFEDTISFIEKYNEKFDKVKPILTPRFVPSVTKDLMSKLGAYGKRNNIPMQTHLSENVSEIEWVRELHPECSGYLDVYDKTDLFGDRSIFAHCIHNTNDEIELLKQKNGFVAHCPTSNYNLSSGISPVRKFLDSDINIGLGTDVGAGHDTSIKSMMIMAMYASKSRWFYDKTQTPLTLTEAFYIATMGGGAFFGKVGSFMPTYEFDCLVIEDDEPTLKQTRTLYERFERYIYKGDDRNIATRFINGKEVVKPF